MKRVLFTAAVLLSLNMSSAAWALDLSQVDVEIHGFVSQGYLISDRNNFYGKTTGSGTFDYDEVGLNAISSLSEDLEVGVQLLSRDFVGMTNHEVRIDWAQATYHYRDELGFRFGKVRSPYGLYTQTRDVDLARTSIFLPQSVYTEFARDTEAGISGAGVFGRLSAGAVGSFDYDMFLGDVDIADDGGEVMFFGDGGSPFSIEEFDAGTTVALRSFWNTPVDGMKLGASLASFAIDYSGSVEPILTRESHRPLFPLAGTRFDQEFDALTYVFSWEYLRGPWTFASEYQLFESKNIKNTTLAGVNKLPSRTSEGSYFLVSYRLSDLLQLGSYYSLFYRDINDRNGAQYSVQRGLPDYAAWQRDLALSLRVDITDFWIVKVEGHYLDGTARTFIDANIDPVTGEGDLDRGWYLGAVKTTVAF